jgi:diguanylate cyclase (GGDEF)-like protein
MEGRASTRRTAVARRSPGDGARAPSLAEREAAILTEEQASRERREAEDRREAAADRRERSVDRREAATARREQALLPREQAAKAAARASARAAAKVRRVNERLVLTTVKAQTRTEAAEQVSAAMSQAAEHDFLTGLPNRSLLADRLERSMAFARRQGHKVALLFLDLDHFKQINDTLGHSAGDLLLQSIARRLQSCVRQTDTVCRQGGDEFVLLLSEIRKARDAILTVRKVIAAMVPPHRIDGHLVAVTVSIGISCFPDDGVDPEALVKAADQAMYMAKQNGRNRFMVFTPSLAHAEPRARAIGRNP